MADSGKGWRVDTRGTIRTMRAERGARIPWTLKTLAVRGGIVDVLIGVTRGRIRVLMYHGVSPYSLPPRLFERQLRYIRRRFESFWASEIPSLLDGRLRPRKPPIVLSFDDCLRNNRTYAAPMLQEAGLKATFYAVSDLLDGHSMLWNNELTCRLLLTADSALPDGLGPLSDDRQRRFAQVERFVEAVKGWEEPRRLELLDRLRTRLPRPSYAAWMEQKYGLMTRHELATLPSNIEVGSHTRTHPILPHTSDERARDEIRGSRDVLESILDRPVRSFCYPNGQFSERDLAYVREAYLVALSVNEGLIRQGDDLHRLRRIPVAHNMTDFAVRMVRPASGGPAPPFEPPDDGEPE